MILRLSLLLLLGFLSACEGFIDVSGGSASSSGGSGGGPGNSGNNGAICVAGGITSCTFQEIWDRDIVTPCFDPGGPGPIARFFQEPDYWVDSTEMAFHQRLVTYADAAHCTSLDETGAQSISVESHFMVHENLDPGATPTVGSGQFFIGRSRAADGSTSADMVVWYDHGNSTLCFASIGTGDSVATVLSNQTSFLLDPANNAQFCLTKI
ncbi:hypothetical protein [Peredibacter starrii]|uniref:Uncharacterized protein n=1 Tax=Peredibacter starrii TaxID=28202 RepID=A0AAX4HNZ9_9BACT|nr:hypothetical protein [Peredibacter starrii]WPU64883.1 hypothetical protein SOO65_19495 [Peredibacter starrii]